MSMLSFHGLLHAVNDMCIPMIYEHLFALDVDECERDTHNCQHDCNNTDGSFQCHCKEGYELDESDGISCNGMCVVPTHSRSN